ncbi:MAG: hypothetical protein JW744_04080 [Candidatus Diapherotrites archaeon]|uniref:DNA primase large subunit PriL n=1 Tax=Candidatus Iainarchaeum sp. TaxID=3101447 RepID=A0A938YUZ4_9ARCH|nr:hypothetical protein [Candidatus Diapherotrites archaeon]
MHTMQQLLFAQHFPFTNTARKIVEEQNLSLDDLPSPVVERAALMVEHAASGNDYNLVLRNSDLLMQELLAFPVAKILISFLRDDAMYRKFSSMFADAALHYLNTSEDSKEAMVELASDLKLAFNFADEAGSIVSISIFDFLTVKSFDPMLKLVNQSVSKGSVFLDLNGFARFLRALAFEKIRASLPVPTGQLPKSLQKAALRFRQNFGEKQAKRIEFTFKGNARPDAFPGCMAFLYSELLQGKRLPHMARFYLASFLNRVGMPKEQIMLAFKKSPDFKEKIASYQIDKIVKQNYTPASCDKVRAAGYCPNSDCNVRNPLSYYRRQLKKASEG